MVIRKKAWFLNLFGKPAAYKFLKDLINNRKRLTRQQFACPGSLPIIPKQMLQMDHIGEHKQNFANYILRRSGKMYESSGSWFIRITTEVQIGYCTKMEFSIKDFFSKCDQIRSCLRIWSHLLKNSLIENFIFCTVGKDAAVEYIADIRFLAIFVNLAVSYHFQKGKQTKS